MGSKCDQHDKRQIQEAEVRTWADVRQQLLGLSDTLCIPHTITVVVAILIFRMQGKRIEYREVSACWASEKVQQLFYDIAEQGLKKMLGSTSSSLSSAASTAAQATSLPEWVPDSSGNSCTSCGADFHFSLRRHHCRRSAPRCVVTICPDIDEVSMWWWWCGLQVRIHLLWAVQLAEGRAAVLRFGTQTGARVRPVLPC